jgi:hypothetical protein
LTFLWQQYSIGIEGIANKEFGRAIPEGYFVSLDMTALFAYHLHNSQLYVLFFHKLQACTPLTLKIRIPRFSLNPARQLPSVRTDTFLGHSDRISNPTPPAPQSVPEQLSMKVPCS